ncbi:carbon-nitrogen hydrolase family protein [Tistrella sp.]|uniref:carbon-nitrogen hydrolase family protein n=1 Tax=Tistrella sp. TaxID=2024861 RepID=UPI000C953FC9|nr:carbon-nitrogen hydrolase family protein [Tistrella sp.]MAD38470.1 amidohydrolase [Tistrella sp.]
MTGITARPARGRSAPALGPERITVAVAAWPVARPDSLQALDARLDQWLGQAVAGGAELAVFPEYGGIEAGVLSPRWRPGDLAADIDAASDMAGVWLDLHRRLARHHRIHLLTGSLPVRDPAHGLPVNRCWLVAPDGSAAHQDKRMMTRFERESWGIGPGDARRVFDTAIGTIGIAICYDAEFPLEVRDMVAAGAEIVLVPSCTDSAAGYHRVRVAARARALEGQCFVIQSPTVGVADWPEAVDVNRGAAGIFAPPDRGLPDDGVVAQGGLDQPGWTIATLDLGALRRVRADGQVLPLRHWDEQASAGRA